MRKGNVSLKKILLIPAALFFLAVPFAFAQDASVTPPHRKHSRPPYSGPRKSGKSAPAPHRPKSSKNNGSVPILKPSSDHVIVR